MAKSEVNASEISNRCIVHRPASGRSTHHQRASGASQDSAQRSLRTEPNARGPAMPLRTYHSFPLQGVAIAACSSPLKQLRFTGSVSGNVSGKGVSCYGVEKHVFCRSKKREFFVFHHEQKKVKQDYVVISKSALFLTETLRICSVNSWFFFFRKKRREKF